MPPQKTAVVLGVTAGIGRGLAERLLSDGWHVIGIGRTLDRVHDLQDVAKLQLYQCNIAARDSVNDLVSRLRDKKVIWDLLLSSVGTMEPIGRFFELDFDDWERSVTINFTGQMRALHALWPLRRSEKTVDVMLLAGGGTNNPFRNYSAYCVSKIALIKMCELIDDEERDANVFIIGPGYTSTRIHEETLRAGPAAAGDGYYKTIALLKTQGTTIDEIYDHMQWCMTQGRSVAGGRNFSTVHDAWRDGSATLADCLRGDPDAFRLRRRQPQ
jgi:NAD(P)-dependent dehydrogenase (short-subunit alcohol dehydrogenase family)